MLPHLNLLFLSIYFFVSTKTFFPDYIVYKSYKQNFVAITDMNLLCIYFICNRTNISINLFTIAYIYVCVCTYIHKCICKMYAYLDKCAYTHFIYQIVSELHRALTFQRYVDSRVLVRPS